MQLIIHPGGSVCRVYAETIDLSGIGRLAISRGSHVEPVHTGHWFADLGSVGGSCLGPFPRRSEALKAEADWLDACWLAQLVT